MKTSPKKRKKLDPNFVSSEKHEIAYIAKKFVVEADIVRKARKVAGKSRRAVYSYLRTFNRSK